ncbi:MAG: amidase, partial [Gaiellaceae bacterium]|nr:amidase [Gaiellaceae bacterium]
MARVNASEELAYTSATELAARIADRTMSPVEIVDAAIERIEQRNPSLTAFVFTAFDEARASARDAERAVSSGEALGPLHGVPVAIKDLFDFKPGWKSTFGGVRALRDLVIDARCLFTERIEAAGAIILGKTNSPVMGFRGTTDNFLFGPSRNPFDTSRNTGGSSGGSAGAVADGLVPLAEGTDGGGSIRIPASWCGVYGIKPSFGRVPFVVRPNGFSSTSPFLAEGPITRTVADAELALTALNGYDSRDPYSLGGTIDYRGVSNRSIAGMRIAYSPDLGVYPVEPAVAETVRRAVDAFAEAGATVEEVSMEISHSHRDLADLWCRMIIPINCAALQAFTDGGIDLLGEHRSDFPPEYLRWLDYGFQMGVVELNRDQEIRTDISDAVASVMNRYDLLVSPTLACLPVKNADDGNTMGPTHVNGEEVER